MRRATAQHADAPASERRLIRSAVSRPIAPVEARPRSLADAEAVPVEPDDVADDELAPAAQIDFAVDGHHPLGDRLLGLAAREDPRELEELAQADRPAAQRDVDGLGDGSGALHVCERAREMSPQAPWISGFPT